MSFPGVPTTTLLALFVHVVWGCCAHHGHQTAAEAETDHVGQRTAASSVIPNAGSKPHTAQNHLSAVLVSTCGMCGDPHSGNPGPCDEGDCSFVSTDTKLPDLSQRWAPALATLADSPLRRALVHQQMMQTPVVFQTGCPLSLRPQPWLQSWLA